MKLTNLIVLPAAVIAAAASALLSVGCANQSEQQFTTDSISFTDTINIGQSRATCLMEVNYPATGNPAFTDSIKLWIARQLADAPIFDIDSIPTPDYTSITDGNQLLRTVGADLMVRSKADFEEYAKDSATCFYEFNWLIRPVCDSTRFVTYASSEYLYLGGAHGGSVYTPATFSKADGHQFGWNMFIPDSLPAVRNMIRTRIMTDFFKVSDPVDFRYCLLIDPDTMPLPVTPPAMMPDGIDFTYMQYEIAPYSAGMPDCIIDYPTISPMLTPQARDLLK